jgi:hypothetical protein
LEARCLLSTFAVVNTDDSGDGSFRWAVDQANSNAGPDAIAFGVTGTIGLNSALPALQGDLTIQGPGAEQLTVERDGSGPAFRIFTIPAGVTANVSGLTVRGGNAVGDGGAFLSSGHLMIDECVLTGNNATVSGGAVAQTDQGSLIVTRSTISHNTASHAGGILALIISSVTISDSVFDSNVASVDGGGLYFYLTSGTVADTTFSNNRADSERGGALKIDDHSHLTLERTTLVGNSAATGGAVTAVHNSVVDVVNSTVASNTAGWLGGGFEIVWASSLNLASSTLANNAVTSGEGGGGGGGLINTLSRYSS